MRLHFVTSAAPSLYPSLRDRPSRVARWGLGACINCAPRLRRSPPLLHSSPNPSRTYAPPPLSTLLSRRRCILSSALLIFLATLTPSSLSARSTRPDVDASVQAVVLCRQLLEPIPRYVSSASWDKARSNVNYCTRNLRLHTAMLTVTREVLTPSVGQAASDEGMVLANELDNIFTQLDASLYTPIFMPSNDEITTGQRKYANEALIYLQEAREHLERFVQLLPESLRERNLERAAARRLPLERQ
ncbi:hypothetical protein CDCA_CDCA03G1079 [Cyanidium caldarium]|uniref:Uncharacterized protein n=1 Tax=Cyanidium caldarium TaxID=2771 RepID=A0AAV9ISD2_CYACA|nr:hypothetical protein CDCA_CDCA03G1079 [Cyanidium caldarium]